MTIRAEGEKVPELLCHNGVATPNASRSIEHLIFPPGIARFGTVADRFSNAPAMFDLWVSRRRDSLAA
ncbi:hypothetical protein [Nocardia sp. NPDC051981]|uniref:hypothetical protein n=1 Tax=Nocardia sp. NPDC051981 TaxID=3155417 RepID=UPI00343B63B6